MGSGRLYLFGAGGHAKVVAEILESANVPVAGFFDGNPNITKVWEYPVTEFPGASDPFRRDQDQLIIAVGDNATRRKLADSLQVNYSSALHPSAVLSHRCRVGEGTVVMAGVVVNSDTTVGRHCIINTCASIDHDCVIGDYAHISPNATLCGAAHVGEGTHVGAGAVIIPGRSVGRWSVIGAGAVVIDDVPDHVTVVGNPARPLTRRA
jgi:sugar O-acyltransferase (sialic acid O-acetyltransferase NeuD family)